MTNKTCTICGETKTIADFYKRNKDVLHTECKRCHNARFYKWKRTEQGMRSRLRYYNSDRYKKLAKKNSLRPATKAWAGKSQRKRLATAEGREKHAARVAVSAAVRKGKLVKATSCACCGDLNAKLQGHHYAGYEKVNRLTVHWLCVICHGEVHRLESLCI